MATVTIHEAKTNPSKLIARAEAGEEIIIARGREPVACLTPLRSTKRKLAWGILAGKYPDIPDSFFSIRCRTTSCERGKAILKILLDSHAYVWFVTSNPRCSARAGKAIEMAGRDAHVSAVTAWELATKARIGK